MMCFNRREGKGKVKEHLHPDLDNIFSVDTKVIHIYRKVYSFKLTSTKHKDTVQRLHQMMVYVYGNNTTIVGTQMSPLMHYRTKNKIYYKLVMRERRFRSNCI